MNELNHGLSVQVVARGLESILDVLDPERRCRRGLEQDDVESAGPVHPMSLSEKLGSQPDEFCCFFRCTAWIAPPNRAVRRALTSMKTNTRPSSATRSNSPNDERRFLATIR